MAPSGQPLPGGPSSGLQARPLAETGQKNGDAPSSSRQSGSQQPHIPSVTRYDPLTAPGSSNSANAARDPFHLQHPPAPAQQQNHPAGPSTPGSSSLLADEKWPTRSDPSSYAIRKGGRPRKPVDPAVLAADLAKPYFRNLSRKSRKLDISNIDPASYAPRPRGPAKPDLSTIDPASYAPRFRRGPPKPDLSTIDPASYALRQRGPQRKQDRRPATDSASRAGPGPTSPRSPTHKTKR